MSEKPKWLIRRAADAVLGVVIGIGCQVYAAGRVPSFGRAAAAFGLIITAVVVTDFVYEITKRNPPHA